MEATRFLTVHNIDGTTETFSFSKQAKDHYELMSKLHDAMTTDRLIIEADTRLHIIPLSSIKPVEFSPLPEVLPKGIIKNAKLDVFFQAIHGYATIFPTR